MSIMSTLLSKHRAAPPEPRGVRSGEVALLTASDWAEIAHAIGRHAAHAVAPVLAHQPNPGEGRSRLRGRGMDYAESRAYQPGDDMRAMHWALLARTGRPYVRVFDEEHAAPWHALIDAHGGMLFGTRTRTKASQAARAALLAAALQASSTPRSGLGLTLWSERGLQTHDFGVGLIAVRRMAAWLMERVIAPPAGPGADDRQASDALDAWVGRIRARAPRPVRVVLCSDFAWLDRHEESTLWTLGAHCQILALQITDPVERALPDLPAAHFSDRAAGLQGWLEPGAALREHFERSSVQRCEGIRQNLKSVGARMAEFLSADSAAAMRAEFLPLMR